MFYQCPKCKNIWQYPIEKCPDCFEFLKRMESKKIKVAGVSKINVVSMAHTKTPYYTLLLEDENGNKWAQKSFQNHEVGQEFSWAGAGSDDPEAVAVWRVKYDFLEAIEKNIEFLGGLDIKSGTKILLLPALNSPKHPYFCENTTPEFLDAAIGYLLAKGAQKENIKIAGQSFNDILIEASVQKSGLLKICLKHGITPIDLGKTEFVKKEDLEISKESIEADLVINLAILKLGQAGATENLFKLLKKENYLGLKYLHDQKEILKKALAALPKILTLAEADSSQMPDKFTVFLGLSLAGFSAPKIDRVFSQIQPISPLPEMIADVKVEEISILGRTVEEVQFNNKNI